MAGRRSILDVLDAEAERFQAASAAVSARYAALFSGYRVLAAQGRLSGALGLMSEVEVTLSGQDDPFAEIARRFSVLSSGNDAGGQP